MLFAIDLRSLALFRIGLGVVLVFDIASRLPNVRAFYSDAGVLPRDALIDRLANPWHLSLLSSNGQTLVVTIVFLLAIVIAAQLVVGYRSRLAAFLCWLFVISVDSRNPLVVHGGDEVMRLLFFWSWQLPLGARFSIDRALDSEPRGSPSYASVASAGLILQICFVYWFTAILKFDPIWYEEGSAVYYALNYDILASSFGKWLLGFPALLRGLTFLTLGLEWIGPALLFVPFATQQLRLLAVVAFVAFHMGLAMSFHLGTFPWIACVGWMAVLPPLVWDRSLSKRKMTERERTFAPSFVAQAFAGGALLLITAWNIAPICSDTGSGLPSPWWEIGSALQINQRWTLFAPYPSTDDGWYVVDAELFDRQRVDPLRDGKPVSWVKPDSVAETMKDSMWRKYFMNVWRRDYSDQRLYLGRYLCRTWNSDHAGDERIKTMHIYYMLETTPPPGTPLPEPEKVLIWRHYCFERPADW